MSERGGVMANKGKAKLRVVLEFDPETAGYLGILACTPAVGAAADVPLERAVVHVLEHLAYSAADGVRRPGAWERQWIQQACGEIPQELLKLAPGVAGKIGHVVPR